MTVTVKYRANGRVAEVSEASAKTLVAARICELVESEKPKRKQR